MPDIDTPFMFENGLSLRNPVVMAPMTTWAGDGDGSLTDAELAYYRARSAAVGMVITGTTFMQADGKGFSGQFYGGADTSIPQLRALADAIKSGGAKAVLQIFHAGRNSTPELTGGKEVLGPSGVAAEREGAVLPRALTQLEIEGIIDSFAEVTRRAIACGFDGVEIHGANTYLLQQFLSPHANRRTDQWGGSRQARASFPQVVVNAVLETVRRYGKPEFIVGYRLSPEEIENPGLSLEDTLYLADRLAETDISYVHLSLRHYALTSQRDKGDARPIGGLFAQQLAGRKPLMGVGQVHSREDMQKAFSIGYELVAVGKALVYDAQWLEKVRSGAKPDGELADAARQVVPQRMFDSLFDRRQAMNVRFAGT